MVDAVTVSGSQSFTLAGGDTEPSLSVTQTVVLAAASYPAESALSMQGFVSVAVTHAMPVTVSQGFVLAAGVGRVSDPALRIWTFTLDNHDFVVIRLGVDQTLVHDLSSGDWLNWASAEDSLWKAYVGCNWNGANSVASGYGSNIIVGDDASGALYFLDPYEATDDGPLAGDTTLYPFERVATGQLISESYGATRVFMTNLFGSFASVPADTPLVTLSYSDDGVNYTEVESLDLTDAQNTYRATWRGLGSYRYPGRLLRITDNGALIRLDHMDVNTGE